MSHTPAKLTAEESRIYANEHFLMANGDWLMAVRHNGEWFPETQRDNVRRLAACWNACENIATTALEFEPKLLMFDFIKATEQHDRLLASCKAWLADEVDDGQFADTLRQIIARTAGN